MDNNKITVIVGLSTLIIGLLIGFIVGDRSNYFPMRGYQGGMHESIGGHMHSNSTMHDHGNMQSMMNGMMFDLDSQSGADYEKSWLSHMIIHHQGAVVMAQDLLDKTDRPELVGLADDIINAQNDEIEMMEDWLEAWYNENN